MKKIILSLALGLLTASIYAQNFKKGEQYYTWVTYMDNTSSQKGYLIQLSDLNIHHLPKNKFGKWMAGDGNVGIKIPINIIKSLKFRKNKKVVNSMKHGGLIGGFGLGFLAMGTDSWFDDGQAFIIGFIPGAIAGSLIGAMIGTNRIRIPINGSQNTYMAERDRIKNYMLLSN